ncbi:MAG: hypothetical protein IM606_11950 [Cytophagales bacterium]|nr:hypothetical protein [Cytophagales bacterium]
MKYLFVLMISLTSIKSVAQTNLTTANALYFSFSGNAPDGFPWARLNENWGIRFNSPDPRWVFSSKPSVLIGYVPSGQNWGNDNLLVAGNVGIGTTTPIRALQIHGELSLTRADKAAFINVSDQNGNGGGSIILRGLDAGGSAQVPATISLIGNTTVSGTMLGNAENAAWGLDNIGDSRLGFIKKAGYAPVIASSSGAPIVFSQTNQSGIFTNISGATITERMRINSDGNVGIGTASPSSNLHVLSSSPIGASLNSEVLITRFSTNVANLQSLDLKLRKYSTTDNYWWGNSLRLQRNIDGAVNSCYIDFGASETNSGAGSHELGFGVDNTEHMRISSGGNVGIGITNPTQKLQVKGTVYSTEVKVDLAAGTGPDYVFEPTYDLKPLAEIETYIKENKHLPEVPSAKEMEKNGVQLGEMNMLLLKKVEELTLYVISQQNKIKEQELRIETLEKRFEK